MAFKVRLSRRAAEQVKELKPAAQPQVIEAFKQLEQRASLGKRILSGPSKGMMGFQFRVEMPPVAELLTAVFQFHQDEVHIEVSTIVRANGDPPDSEPPSDWLKRREG